MVSYSPDTFFEGIPITLSFEENGKILHSKIYQINPQHRNGSSSKSQWTITRKAEVELFGWANEKESKSGDYYWGVIQHNNKCIDLGITVAENKTKIARFVHSHEPIIWHGYPVDYIQDPQNDCPRRELLLKWKAMGIIEKHQISRLTSGKGWNG